MMSAMADEAIYTSIDDQIVRSVNSVHDILCNIFSFAKKFVGFASFVSLFGGCFVLHALQLCRPSAVTPFTILLLKFI